MRKKRLRWGKLFLTPFSALLTFALVFGPRLHVIDVHMVASIVLAGVGVLCFLTGHSANRALFVVFAGAVIASVYSFAVSVVYGGLDYTMSWIMVKYVLYLLAAVGITNVYKAIYRNRMDDRLVHHLIIAGAINGAVVPIALFNSSVRGWLSSVLVLDTRAQWVRDTVRSFDLSLGGATAASVEFGLLFILTVYVGSYSGRRMVSAICGSILLAASVLTGRTGLFIIAAGLLLLFLWKAMARPGFVNGGTGGTYVAQLLLITFLAVIATAATALYAPSVVSQAVTEVFPWAFEWAYTGSVMEVRSVDTIVRRMYFFPEEWHVLLFGSSNAGRSSELPYIPSDVGYVRTVFAVGVVGMLMIYGVFIYTMTVSFRRRGASLWAYPVLFYSILTLIANFKQLHVAHRGGGIIFAILLVCMLKTSGNCQK